MCVLVCVCVCVRVSARFDYYNIGMRPRRLQRDRRQLVAHLELDQLLAVQRPSAVRDLTVSNHSTFLYSTWRSLGLPQHILTFGSRAFHIAAYRIWNSLPSNILECQALASFRRHLKTYFQSAYPAPSLPSADLQCDFLLRRWHTDVIKVRKNN